MAGQRQDGIGVRERDPMPVPDPGAPAGTRSGRILLVAALILAGLSMRTAVTSIGAVLGDIEEGLHAGSSVAGVITTMPALCFAVFGALAPLMASRIGPHRLLVLALTVTTTGLVARAVVDDAGLFIVLTVLSLVAAAVANVLMPTLVKWHFPDRIGRMTAVYTTALAVGTTIGAGLTVPIGSIAPPADQWRTGIGSWALVSAVAAVPWLAMLRHDVHFTSGAPRLSIARMARSRTAWMVALFFAFQSIQAYIAFGWFERLLTDHGIGDVSAGWMVAVVSAVTIPLSMIVPSVPPRYHRIVLIVMVVCYAVAYTGLLVAPVPGAWAWMVLAGTGGTMFPLSLVLIGYRSGTAETTAALSAFAQGFGYVVSACGPVLFGVLHDATGGWPVPFAVLWVSLAGAALAGWRACVDRTVDDDLATGDRARG
jgi:CP family cyanate transporter-like MFS transporter